MNNSNVVKFKDKNLEQVIRIIINKPKGDILKEEMGYIKKININDFNKGKIKDLEGIQYAINLEDLNLLNQDINDIHQLSKLVNLKALGLVGNKIKEISALRNLTKLKMLAISHNNITDITPLENLVKLESLLAQNNNISDISSLSRLIEMEWLYLENNKISDIKPLENLTKLEALNLDNNYIEDIKPLKDLTNLDGLQIKNNRIYDIGILRGLNGLEVLTLSGNKIIDYSPVEKYYSKLFKPDFEYHTLEYSNLYLLFVKIKKDIDSGLFNDIYSPFRKLKGINLKTKDDYSNYNSSIDRFAEFIYTNPDLYELIILKDKYIGRKAVQEVRVTQNTKKGKYIFFFIAVGNYRVLCNYVKEEDYDPNTNKNYLIPNLEKSKIEIFSRRISNQILVVNTYKAFLSYCDKNNFNVVRTVNKPFYDEFEKALKNIEGFNSILSDFGIKELKNDKRGQEYKYIFYNGIFIITHYIKKDESEDIRKDTHRYCIFCGNEIYNDDIVCSICANNID
ncbi:leucine-rich repeat domain-containing protein [Clostridium aestuarii]|uniref:Leucine-rich repeat domain-containing protein n=1 Tax=Clostridium aestuarii TaxID=338193 RepID=A0ABT4CW99_9CLOT|nr:leucine-rich repeat domain-containing protein [Clostridium aestuarii]MCY6483258.1 leucine-rich repeat domain-containing protein [Clostridium aestuarii]